MFFVLYLLVGLGASAYVLYAISLPAGVAGIVLTLGTCFYLIRRKTQALMADPEKRKQLEQKQKNLADKLGLTNQVLENGQSGHAIILKMKDTEFRMPENGVLELLLTLRVQPDAGEEFQAEVKKDVPMILLPQFQPGKKFRIKYDSENQHKIELISFEGDNGVLVQLSDYN